MEKTIGYVILEAGDTESNATIISTTEHDRRVIAEGIVQEAELENRNGRSYLLTDLKREIGCERTIELITSGNMKGEAGHPLDSDIIRQQTILPDRCNVKYLKFWTEGNLIKAQFRGTNTALGDAFDADLRDGDKPSFSLRALGTLEVSKGRNLVRNLKMITYDNVIYPSHKKAYTDGILTESAVTKDIMDINEHGRLIPITNKVILDYIKLESANVKNILKQVDVLYESVEIINNKKDVKLVSRNGDIFVINLESYIRNEISEYYK